MSQNLENEVIGWQKMIGFFSHSGQNYWIVDWMSHFNLDYQKEIDAYCEKPELQKYKPKEFTTEEWRADLMNNFREGIPILTSDQFHKYLDIESATLVNTEILRDVFWSKDNGEFKKYVSEIDEKKSDYQNFPRDLKKLGGILFSLLPKFYINFDEKSFKHIISDRMFEHYVPQGWTGKMEEFGELIPENERYWTNKDGLDMSKYV